MNSTKQPLLQINKIEKHYDVKGFFGSKGRVQALRGVELDFYRGETLAIVGESGCGKSTLARLLMGLEKPTKGNIAIEEKSVSEMKKSDLVSSIQMIFQDPHSSLNPRKKIKDLIAEPLVIQGMTSVEIDSKIKSISESVGIRAEWLERYPHMLSGGQKQRVGIARALVTQPKILVCDEPVSALDVSVQAQVLNLLLDLKDKYNLSYIFISHDLSVVKFIADRIAVLYLGQIVELGSCREIFKLPQHPYTQLLLSSAPHFGSNTDRGQADKASELPSPLNPPSGCGFRTRCPHADQICSDKKPELRQFKHSLVACHKAEEIKIQS